MIYLARKFLISIPEEVDESAMVDGCTQFQAFRKFVLSLAKPGTDNRHHGRPLLVA
jgi:multiple sugar transport system permease protein